MAGVAQAKVLQFRRTVEDETTTGENVALIPIPIHLSPGMAQTFSVVYRTFEGTITTEAPQFQVFSYPVPPSGVQEKELAELRERVRALEEHLATIGNERDSKVIVLRAISQEDAKTEILRLFQENHAEVLDYGIIAERLQLDLQIVVDVCNELEKEGLIG